MVKYIFIFLTINISIPLLSQSYCDTIFKFSHPEEYPKPEMSEVLNFIAKKIIYPETAIKDKVDGTVVVWFLVDTLGYTLEHKIVKGIRGDLDNEALRVAKLIKFDEPAKNRGKPIIYCYSVPFVFKLSEKTQKSRWWHLRRSRDGVGYYQQQLRLFDVSYPTYPTKFSLFYKIPRRC